MKVNKNFVEGGKIMELIRMKYFAESVPQNAKSASATIGSGADGTVTVTVDEVGTEGNNYTIEVVAGSGTDINMSAVLDGTDIVVTLGTDATGALDATKNTATLVADAIDALDGVSAIASGTGATALSSAEAKKNFTGGQYGTIAPSAGYVYIDGDNNTVYISIASNSKKGANWRKFTLTDF